MFLLYYVCMKRVNKFQFFNILIFSLFVLFLAFEVGKYIYWSTCRPLETSDFQMISTHAIQLIVFSLMFFFCFNFEKNKRFRISSIVFYLISLIFALAYSFTSLKNVIAVYTSIHYVGFTADHFTSMFEFFSIALITLLLLSYLIFLLKIKYFSRAEKTTPPPEF